MSQLVGHSLALTGLRWPGAGGGEGSPPEVAVDAVHFDGTNDNLLRGGALTGPSDGAEILLSIWFNITGNDATAQLLYRDDQNGVLLSRNASDKIRFKCRSAAPVNLWDWSSDNDFDTSTNTGWHHLLVATQLDSTPVGQVYLDDVALDITTAVALTEGNIDWTTTEHSVGSTPSETSRFDGDMSDVYITNEYLDIDIVSNRRKFISVNGKPVDLESDGSGPTGTAAIIFLSGAVDTWHTNDGTGGGFTETGALTAASTSPSD